MDTEITLRALSADDIGTTHHIDTIAFGSVPSDRRLIVCIGTQRLILSEASARALVAVINDGIAAAYVSPLRDAA